MRVFAVLISLPFVAAACASSAVVPGVPGTPTAAVIRPGDAVRITVWRNEELSGEFDVGEDGTIRHPLYREIRVAGLTAREAETRVGEFLQRYEASPQFILEPLLRVAVGGEVRLPDLYAMPPATTIAEAVARAGGVTQQGRLDRVILIRDGRQWDLDLTQPEEGLAQLPVRSGDQILVRRRPTWLRDYVAPIASVLGGLALIINYATR